MRANFVTAPYCRFSPPVRQVRPEVVISLREMSAIALPPQSTTESRETSSGARNLRTDHALAPPRPSRCCTIPELAQECTGIISRSAERDDYRDLPIVAHRRRDGARRRGRRGRPSLRLRRWCNRRRRSGRRGHHGLVADGMRCRRLNRPAGRRIKGRAAVSLHLTAVARRASALHHGAAVVRRRRRGQNGLAAAGAGAATRVTAAIAAVAGRAVIDVAAIGPVDPVGAALAPAASFDARLILNARVVPFISARVIRAATTRGPGGSAQTQDQQ